MKGSYSTLLPTVLGVALFAFAALAARFLPDTVLSSSKDIVPSSLFLLTKALTEASITLLSLFGLFVFVSPPLEAVAALAANMTDWLLLALPAVLLLGLFMRVKQVFRRLLLKMRRVYPTDLPSSIFTCRTFLLKLFDHYLIIFMKSFHVEPQKIFIFLGLWTVFAQVSFGQVSAYVQNFENTANWTNEGTVLGSQYDAASPSSGDPWVPHWIRTGGGEAKWVNISASSSSTYNNRMLYLSGTDICATFGDYTGSTTKFCSGKSYTIKFRAASAPYPDGTPTAALLYIELITAAGTMGATSPITNFSVDGVTTMPSGGDFFTPHPSIPAIDIVSLEYNMQTSVGYPFINTSGGAWSFGQEIDWDNLPWHDYSITFTAPDDDIQFNITNDNTGAQNRAYVIDNIVMTANNPSYTIAPASSALLGGLVGTSYTQNLSSSGGGTWEILTGSLPPGLTLNTATGAITGTPTTAGTYNFELKAQTADGCLGGGSYSIAIAAMACAITVTSAVPTVCDPVDNTYDLAVTVTYSTPPTGNITVTTTTGASISVAQTGSPQVITLTGLQANGYPNVGVTAVFANDMTCTHTLTSAYTAPTGCWVCAGNLLVNPSFESGMLTSPPFSPTRLDGRWRNCGE